MRSAHQDTWRCFKIPHGQTHDSLQVARQYQGALRPTAILKVLEVKSKGRAVVLVGLARVLVHHVVQLAEPRAQGLATVWGER